MRKTHWVALAIVLLGLLSIIGLAGFKWLPSDPTLSAIAPYHHRILTSTFDATPQIAAYEKQLRTNPDGPLALSALAALYVRQAKLTGDLSLFDRAETLARHSLRELKFRNEGAKLILADIAQARHEFERSIQITDEVLRDPLSRRGLREGALLTRTTAALALGDLAEAGRSADTLIDLDPSVRARTLRALVLAAQGRDSEAQFSFSEAYRREAFGDAPESVWLRTMWGRFYLRQGHLKEARGLFKEALRILPNDPLALGLLAELETRQKNYPEAELLFSEAFSASKQVTYLLGQVEVKTLKGDPQGAQSLRTQVEKIVRNGLKQSSYGHRTELVRVLLDRGQPGDLPEAISLAHEETRLRHNSETRFFLARAYVQAGKWNEARAAIREILRSGVRDAEYFATAGVIEKALGHPADADFYLKQARQVDASFALPAWAAAHG